MIPPVNIWPIADAAATTSIATMTTVRNGERAPAGARFSEMRAEVSVAMMNTPSSLARFRLSGAKTRGNAGSESKAALKAADAAGPYEAAAARN